MWGYSVYSDVIYITLGKEIARRFCRLAGSSTLDRELAGQRINPDPFRIVQKKENTYVKR
jgi:hypothetical protein